MEQVVQSMLDIASRTSKAEVINGMETFVMLFVCLMAVMFWLYMLVRDIYDVVKSKRTSDKERRMLMFAVEQKIEYLRSLADVCTNPEEAKMDIRAYLELHDKLVRTVYRPKWTSWFKRKRK